MDWKETEDRPSLAAMALSRGEKSRARTNGVRTMIERAALRACLPQENSILGAPKQELSVLTVTMQQALFQEVSLKRAAFLFAAHLPFA